MAKIFRFSNHDGKFWLVAANDRKEAMAIKARQGWDATRIREAAYFSGEMSAGKILLEEHRLFTAS